MTIDSKILDALTAAAKASPRLRMNYDMRTSPEDSSQRMLNALEPGTQIPIHRHPSTSETVVLLRGSAVQYFYNEAGEVVETVELSAPGSAMSVEPGRWHRLESLESGTVIFECKDGRFQPIGKEDIMEIQ